MKSASHHTQQAPADAPKDNWVDRLAPKVTIAWLRLMRADRPIGTWLLLLPCYFGMSFALTNHPEQGFTIQSLFMVIIFAIGAFVMRGAGCVYNDIADRDFDAQVARTALRPIPSGQVSVKGAWIFLICLCLIGLGVLLQFNINTILLGISSLALVAAYPFMKRITYWPQLWLGLTFNWGALVGYSAITSTLTFSAILIYIGCIFWTLGYDTIYAHQDKEDDALIGVKSTALRFGETTKLWLSLFYGLVIILFMIAFWNAEFSLLSYFFLIPAALHFAYQIHTLDINDGHKCLKLFKANRNVGFFLLLSPTIEIILKLVSTNL